MRNILFITEYNPFRFDYGAQQRTHLLFQALQKVGHVHLFCMTEEEAPEVRHTDGYTVQFWGIDPRQTANESFRSKLWALLKPFIVNTYYKKAVQAIRKENNFDFLVVRYLQPVFTCGLYNHKGLILDVDDLPYQYYYTMARSAAPTLLTRLYYLFGALYAGWLGSRIIRRATRAFYSNPEQVRRANGVFLPNIPFFQEAPPENYRRSPERQVLFIGNLDYAPNRQGIDHFIRAIWPLVIAQVADAKLEIVGALSDERQREIWTAAPGVTVRGFVPDLSACYTDSRVVVVPVRAGAGTHIKILEAMQYRKACVVHEFAARGFADFLVHGQNIMLASTDADFTDAVIRLLTQDTLNQQLGEAAGRTISGRYTREGFERILRKALS